jgi:hypothetical protein
MVVRALIAAKKAASTCSFDRACAIDLATKGTRQDGARGREDLRQPQGHRLPEPRRPAR